MFTLKKILHTFLFVLNIMSCLGQNKISSNIKANTSNFKIKRGVNIIYYVESSSKKNQYLIPFIELELKNMKDQKDSLLKRSLFRSVQSFNFLTSGDKANDTLISTFLTIDKTNKQYRHSKSEIEAHSRIIKHLKSNQYFLKIDINTLNNLIEYQFILYKINNNPTNDFDYLELENYRTTSVFINPDNIEYKDRIRMGLRQLIMESNESPVPSIFLNGKPIKDKDTIFSSSGNNLFLTASAIDKDSPNDELQYSWEIRKGDYILYNQSGKELGAFVSTTDTAKLTIKVSDGISTAARDHPLVIRKKPEVKILNPKKYNTEEFVNNKYILYSYNKTFKFNDFSSLITYYHGFYFTGDEDLSRWSKIIPQLIIATRVDENHIGISEVKFRKNGEDSIADYREKPIPYSSSEYYWQIADESALFNLQYFGKKPDKQANKDSIKNQYIYTYSVLENSNSKETIKVPSTRYFKVIVYDHNIKNSTDFLVQFRKISRFSLLFNMSDITFPSQNHFYNFGLFGIGGEYLLSSGISFDGFIGTLTSQSFSAQVLPYSKVDLNIKLFSYYNWLNASLMIRKKIKKTYLFTSTGQYYNSSDYRSRIGFGGSLGTGYSKSKYSPFTEELFYTYYPNGYHVGYFSEIGLRATIHFAK